MEGLRDIGPLCGPTRDRESDDQHESGPRVDRQVPELLVGRDR
jgi:hypothetical protein